MIKQTLHDGWTVRPTGDLAEVPPQLRDTATSATVPGCVHTDLLRAGRIPDPYLDRNEFDLQWIGHTDWQYRTSFDADPRMFDHERIDLVADGLDTVARIELNGQLVAETQNMHRGYRFDVRQHLKRGRNELAITFASPVKYALVMREKLGPRPYCNGPAGPFNFIRKMACNFGWDWGPGLPTCGIWRGIRLEGWSGARIATLAVQQTHTEFCAVRVSASIERTRSFTDIAHLHGELRLSDGRSFVRSDEALEKDDELSLSFEFHHPPLWWPVGYGNQLLQEISISLAGYIDEIENRHVRIGLRTVELDTSPDDIGRKFVINVNGKPIFCKGFNWIPDDCFLDRACDRDRVRERIGQAIDPGGNMLRVWGGGIFETDEFYDICDELGVLVWQDFLFACAMYPEEEPFRSEVEAEARYNVARLAHHPSLAIWNGCNENIWAYRDWGWKDAVKDKTWGKGYYFDLLPKICKELTPTIPYWAGSPWSGDYDVDDGIPPNEAAHGNKHIWDAPAVVDYRNYRQFEPRFASEFGVQGPANYSTIARVVPVGARDFGSPEMRHRQKSGDPVRDDADRKNLRQIVRDFNLPGAAELLAALDSPDPKAAVPECGCGPLHPAKSLPSKVNFDDLHYLLSVQQCRALTTAVEWMRSRQPTCMGTLYWQLNDCWPGGTTWSCIDGDGKPKPLWYATKNFYADVLVTFQPEKDGSLSLYVVNESEDEFDHQVLIRRDDFYDHNLDRQQVRVRVAPRSVGRVAVDPRVATPGDPAREVLWADVGLAAWFFAPDKELCYPKPEFEVEWDGRRLTLTAQTLMRDVCVFADRIDPDARVSQQMLTLMASETCKIEIESARPLTLQQLTSPPVLRCVNPFGKG
jgi:beta-mannosidase